MAYSKKIQNIVNKAVGQANKNAARRASHAAKKSAAAVSAAGRSGGAKARATMEKNMGGIQRAGRSVDRGIKKAGAAWEAGSTAVSNKLQRGAGVVNKKVIQPTLKGESKLMGKIGRAMGSNHGKKFDANMGRLLTYGTGAGTVGAKVAVDKMYGSPSSSSSWSEKKKEGGSSGWQKPTPYGF